jgi:hypothetical protein
LTLRPVPASLAANPETGASLEKSLRLCGGKESK